MSIRFRILCGCLTMLCVTIGLGLYERGQAAAMGQLAVEVYEKSLLAVSYARSAEVGFMGLVQAERSDPPLSEKQRAKIMKDVLADLDVAIERTRSPTTRAAKMDFRRRLKQAGGQAEIPPADAARQFEKLVELLTADAFMQRTDVDEMIDRSERSIRMALGASVACAILITLLLGASIVRPVRRAMMIAGAIANGRLDNTIDTGGRSETARLLQALADMQAALAVAAASVLRSSWPTRRTSGPSRNGSQPLCAVWRTWSSPARAMP